MIELQYVSTFLEVAKSKSMKDAAQKMRLTQPAITSRIKNLEQQVGCSLFYRRRSGMELNDDGKEFFKLSVGLDRELEKIDYWIQNKKGDVSGKIVVACPSTFMSYILPGFLKIFLQRYPKVSVSIFSVISQVVEESVIKGDSNIGVIIGRSVKNSLKIQELCDSHMVMVCSPEHYLAGKKDITKSDIIKARIIWFADQRSRTVHAILKHMGLKYEETEGIKVSDLEASKAYVRKGLGLAIMSRWQLADEVKEGKLVILQGLNMNRPFCMISRNDKYESPAVVIFKKALIEYCRTIHY